MGEFCDRYPKVRVFFGLDDHFSDLIEDGYDVGVRTGMMPDSRMVARNLAQIPLYVVASPEYWDKHGLSRAIRKSCPTTTVSIFSSPLPDGCANGNLTTMASAFRWM
ncbi:LysR substrate-binding domain-containing protein [Paludibacterium denitrificans]|uniref:LysR substrate-binding domain-containing protein n=1 Tax=Paludibacterium denitrificans TaxID=2675226 RepID=UPI00247818CD|nr:LysR substrate-binding domain-containing protein [Paludibacterium denitrificans]